MNYIKLLSAQNRYSTVKEMLFRIINGLSAYVAAWLIIFGAYQLSGAYISNLLFHIPAKVFSCYNVYFPGGHSWTNLAIVVTFGIGPIFAGLIIIMIANIIGKLPGPDRSVFREFIGWIRIHAITLIFGNIIAGVISGFGAAHALRIMFGTSVLAMGAIGFFCLAALIGICFLITENYVTDIISRRSLGDDAATPHMWISTIGSWLVGGCIIFLIVFSRVPIASIPMQNLVLYWLTVIPPVVFMAHFKSTQFNSKANGYTMAYSQSCKPVKFSIIMFGVFLCACTGWHFLFARGLRV